MKRGGVAAAVLAPVLLIGGVVAAANVGRDDPPPPPAPSPSPTVMASPTNAAVEKYVADVKPIIEEGGKVVELGIKPALADYASGKETLGELAIESRAWIIALSGVKRKLAAVPAPPELTAAHATYLRSLDQYLDVAKTLQRASRDRGAKRSEVVRRVTRLGDAADDTYDEAVRLVSEHR